MGTYPDNPHYKQNPYTYQLECNYCSHKTSSRAVAGQHARRHPDRPDLPVGKNIKGIANMGNPNYRLENGVFHCNHCDYNNLDFKKVTGHLRHHNTKPAPPPLAPRFERVIPDAINGKAELVPPEIVETVDELNAKTDKLFEEVETPNNTTEYIGPAIVQKIMYYRQKYHLDIDDAYTKHYKMFVEAKILPEVLTSHIYKKQEREVDDALVLLIEKNNPPAPQRNEKRLIDRQRELIKELVPDHRQEPENFVYNEANCEAMLKQLSYKAINRKLSPDILTAIYNLRVLLPQIFEERVA